jgi:integrase
MILLGINAGYGNTDCGRLDLPHVDLAAGIVDLPRPKTGVPRRAVLWSETVEALREVIEQNKRRRLPAELEDLIFVTTHGRPYVGRNAKGTELDAITTQFRKLMARQGVYRPGLGFYSLRRTFRTIADETKDFPACDLVMGHIAADVAGAPHSIEMAARYRGRIGDDRLRVISDHVRAWLFGKKLTRRRARRRASQLSGRPGCV